MSDPLSITAGIIAVLQLAQRVIQYIVDAKDASDNRNKILTEITSARSLLFLLKDKANNSKAQWDNTFYENLKALDGPNGALEQFKHALERLASKLRPREGLKKLSKSVTWPFEKSEIRSILDAIERQKYLFILALQNDHMYVILIILVADYSALSQ